MPKSITKEEFIQRSKLLYGNSLDYSMVNYINFRTPVLLKCKQHDWFQVTPNLHLLHNKCCDLCFSKRCNTKKIIII